jgi:hypothetical protein
VSAPLFAAAGGRFRALKKGVYYSGGQDDNSIEQWDSSNNYIEKYDGSALEPLQ